MSERKLLFRRGSLIFASHIVCDVSRCIVSRIEGESVFLFWDDAGEVEHNIETVSRWIEDAYMFVEVW